MVPRLVLSTQYLQALRAGQSGFTPRLNPGQWIPSNFAGTSGITRSSYREKGGTVGGSSPQDRLAVPNGLVMEKNGAAKGDDANVRKNNDDAAR